MTVTNFTSPGTMQDFGGGDGSAWDTPDNAKVEDGSYTEGDISGGGWTSSTLLANNFGFTIPSDATINGIIVEVKRQGSFAMDALISLIKGGVTLSDDLSVAEFWSGFNHYVRYGGKTNLWGLTLTPADVNHASFGFVLAAQNTSGGGSASVDHIRMKVYFTNPAKTIQGLSTMQGVASITM